MSLGLLRNPEGAGFPGSRNLQPVAGRANPELIAGTGMHWGVVAAFVAVIFAYILLQRGTSWASRSSWPGKAPRAARFAGVNPNRLIVLLPRASRARWRGWRASSR